MCRTARQGDGRSCGDEALIVEVGPTACQDNPSIFFIIECEIHSLGVVVIVPAKLTFVKREEQDAQSLILVGRPNLDGVYGHGHRHVM